MNKELAGKTVDSFKIVAELGRGAVWCLWRGRDDALDRDATIMVLTAEPAAEPDATARFSRESAAMIGVSHPNLMPVLSAGELGGRPYSMSDLPGSHTLEEMLEARGRIEIHEAVEIARQIADGLQHAHDRGVLHRGLRPADIMVNIIGKPRIANFGVTRPAAAAGRPGTTAPPVSDDADLADIAYLAPEQCRGDAVDARTDIYAAGAILYRMIAGVPPFESLSADTLIEKITTQTPPLLSDFRPGIADDLVSIVNKAMEFDPEERFATAQALAGALDRFNYKSFEATSVTRATRQIGAVPAVPSPPAAAGSARKGALPIEAMQHSPDSVAAMSESTYRIPSDSELAGRIIAAERALARRRMKRVAAWSAAVLILGLGAAAAYLQFAREPRAESGPVPAATGGAPENRISPSSEPD